MKKSDWKVALLLSLICLVGGLLVVPYQLTSLQKTFPEQYELLVETMPLPYTALLLLTGFQLAVISFVLAFIGVKLARKAGFSLDVLYSLFNKEKVRFDRKGVMLSILFGVIAGFVIIGGDRFYFQYQIAIMRETEPSFSLLGLVTGVFYGGVFEEILMRLVAMSLLVWIFKLIFQRQQSNLAPVFYWIAIVIASVLFAAGHLPATSAVFGDLTVDVVVRCFLLNGIGGLFFGYLYWKKGFEYAIIAHMFTHISMQLLFIPLFY
ncbi:CPBP family intramembrane metalloprotease [Lysinibacillus yapensis]|uniref:CPBP family intramembrane metalloprotease n=1 Tax=Ureibacillus yapensis TaxID=2304605 RepID=A0A396S4Z9_9BACL|nr:CPBP family intramembrane glutamic endopeptidase [Lysinibacillus yapensis]RHW34760.1 CPBP family intramembrane metalloprotease [Lysinibacillus yapensis]